MRPNDSSSPFHWTAPRSNPPASGSVFDDDDTFIRIQIMTEIKMFVCIFFSAQEISTIKEKEESFRPFFFLTPGNFRLVARLRKRNKVISHIFLTAFLEKQTFVKTKREKPNSY